MEVSAYSHIGLVRKSNEDAYCVGELGSPIPAVFAAVADGMGGHQGGALASKIAIATVESVVRSAWGSLATPEEAATLLKRAAVTANENVLRESIKHFGSACMGTTLTAALAVGSHVYLVHAGDSRAYIVGRDGVRQVTFDHSLVGEMVRNGDLTESEAMTHPNRNILTNALGAAGGARFDTQTICVEDGDVLILCTDGLTNLVGRDEIADMARTVPFESLARVLVEAANARGGYDNATVVALKFGVVAKEAGGGGCR